MKAFFITTKTNETHKHHESFASIKGNEVCCYFYNHKHHDQRADEEIYAHAKSYAPNLIVYVGAASSNAPSPKLFGRIRADVAPTVHLCSDAADEPWWPFLQAFEAHQSFNVQVALDGNKNWPLADKGITALTVVDHSIYPARPPPHAERSKTFAFGGNTAGSRGPLLAQLPGVKIRERDRVDGSYQAFVDFMLKTRITINFPHTGSGATMHVKGRVIEAALAGCLLLEAKDSPTADWFTPGKDYLEYDSMEHAIRLANFYADKPSESQAIAERLRRKVKKNHSPRMFWGRIMDKIK